MKNKQYILTAITINLIVVSLKSLHEVEKLGKTYFVFVTILFV